MENCRYQEINSDEEKKEWRPFLRQMYVCSGVWCLYFVTGMAFGAPTVFIPQIRREANSTEAVSDEMASWLYSAFGYSALPWIFILCISTRYIGRKIPYAFVAINTLAYNLLLYFSLNNTQILISQIMQGVNHGSMTLAIVIVTEYTSPKYRGLFLTVKCATFFWGLWAANAIGTFFHWKYIPLLAIFISFYTLSIVFWPESPQWLASKGKFEQCTKAHRWLCGTDKKAEKELELLIESQAKLIENTKKEFLMEYIKEYMKKSFLMPMFLSVVMMSQYHLSGKVICTVYVIDIIKKITNSEKAAYNGMLILDGVTVCGMYIGCFCAKYIKRRTLLFSTSITSIIFLFIISLYLYLIKLEVVLENEIVTIALLILFSVTISAGPIVICSSIYGEITPLKFKSTCMTIGAMTFVILASTSLKLTPVIFNHLGMHGAFLFYGLSSGVCTLLMYFYLPETKDKTLQEIEETFENDCVDKLVCKR